MKTAQESIVGQFLREYLLTETDSRFGFWKTVDIQSFPYDHDDVYVSFTGVIDAKKLRADVGRTLRDIASTVRCRDFAEIVQRMGRTRMIGPYRWRK